MTERAPLTLAQRREALVSQCEFQRREAGALLHGMLAPVARPAGMLASLRERLGGRLAMPLAVAGAVLGLIAVRKKGAVAMIAAACRGRWLPSRSSRVRTCASTRSTPRTSAFAARARARPAASAARRA